ncbi:MAG: efflux RND transporter periplasmic adaptor subunit [Rhizobiaceae bacterium]
MFRMLLVLLTLAFASCQDSEVAESEKDPPVRGLKTVLVQNQEETTTRRYPSVLQPAEITTLSFETPGKLEQVDLKVGQQVKKGDILIRLDRRALEIQVESAQSAVSQAQSSARNAFEDFNRQNSLFKKKVTTKAKVDQARTAMETSQEQLEQARNQVEISEDNLKKAVLKAPFDGIINSVEVESFVNVAAATPVATIYSAEGFEVSFSVNYEVISRLAVGKRAKIRLADNPSIVLAGIVSELGSRADTVSSFPIVVKLREIRPEMKAGMAVEVSMEFTVPSGQGFTIPLTALPMKGEIDRPANPDEPGSSYVFVFDEATSTVKRRDIKIGGVSENEIIAVEGLQPGDRVASAGVTFLREGQTVKLLSEGQ